MLQKGSIVKGSVAYVKDDGYGVVIVNKEKVQLKRVLEQEEVSVRILKAFQGGYEGELVEILKPSPQRVKASCGIYEKCGSCHYLHMQYPAQLNLKQKQLNQLFAHNVSNVYGMETPFHYRNKMIIGFAKRGKDIIAGFYEEHSHRIIPYRSCPLHPVICDEIIQSITQLMKECRMEPYDEARRTGLIRHVLIRYGEVSKQIMVVLVSNQKVFPARKAFVSALTRKHPEISTIIWNVNTRRTSIVLGEEEHVLYGKGYIEDTLCGMQYRISPRSFYQINHTQCELLYEKAVSLLRLQGNERLVDAYCGIGTIGMYASSFVREVIGVESNRDAIADARLNAKMNNIRNIRFVCDDATYFLQKLSQAKEQVDVLIMDPPRSGSTEVFIRSAANLQVKQILYISCGPDTQARDLKLFHKLGYEVRQSFGVDMFPHTYHCESVALLVKSNTKKIAGKPVRNLKGSQRGEKPVNRRFTKNKYTK